VIDVVRDDGGVMQDPVWGAAATVPAESTRHLSSDEQDAVGL
jgi:hypothetical protein